MLLSVFTINIWGLKFVGKNRTARVKALADCLISNGYDVVCLQELWCEDDYVHLKRYCKQAFKHIHYFHSGMLGSGMCIMSRYPIIDIHYHSFIVNGYLHMLFHGDWFGGKGIGLCRINVNGFIVDIYTTHLHACYDILNDKYLNHRILQAFETANFMRITSNGSDLAILAGDLNSEPNDICYKLISLGANMKDCYSTCSKNAVEYTFNNPRNSYSNPKEIKSRLDFILYACNKKNVVTVKEHRYSLPSRVPGQNFSYSDHEPIEAVFEISTNKYNVNKEFEEKQDFQYKAKLQEVINKSLEICNENSVINPISSWYFMFLPIFIFITVYYSLPQGDFIFSVIILFFTIMFLYNLVIKSIERNCVRGFCHQISNSMFCD